MLLSFDGRLYWVLYFSCSYIYGPNIFNVVKKNKNKSLCNLSLSFIKTLTETCSLWQNNMLDMYNIKRVLDMEETLVWTKDTLERLSFGWRGNILGTPWGVDASGWREEWLDLPAPAVAPTTWTRISKWNRVFLLLSCSCVLSLC